ncbi:MAG: TPM domain-containing protein [Clostridia bacterium]|nr:TPM domain-containing protein [Clostridia bacterium]
MKKIICILFAAFILTAACIAVCADTPLLNSDKSDNENGMPYWYPLDTTGFTDFHGENLPYVVDDADIMTDAEEAQLSAKIGSIVEKYGIGYVAFTDDDLHGLSPEYYSSDFLHFNGYGTGDEYGAVTFFLCFDPDDRCWRTTAINSCEDYFTEEIMYEIDETVDSAIRSGDYYDAFMLHANYVEDLFEEIATTENWTPEDHDFKYTYEDEDDYDPYYENYGYRNGRSKEGPSAVTVVGAGLIVGLIGGGIRVASLRKKMKINPPRTANNYLIYDSYIVRDRRCDYLYTTVTRHAKPQNTSSSSGGGSHGGSSFSSGHSSGGSFSSGGRSF